MRHEIEAAIVFRESHHLADARFAADQHDQAIKAERDAAVGRRPKAKRAEEMAEERLLVFFTDTERGENLRLQFRLVDSDAAAAQFYAV